MKRTLKETGELGFLEALAPLLRRHTEGLPLATGDDVAITPPPPPGRLVWTLDTMIENTHFRWYDHPLATAAHWAEKLVASNVSDLASKGATPLYGLISLGAPASESIDRLEDFYAGLDAAAGRYGMRLIGGDTVRATHWALTLALVGTLGEDVPIAARANTRPGQNVYISGWPGEAAAGYEILEGRLLIDEPHHSHLVRRCVRPEARLDLGRRIARRFGDLAMIDVSDGVARDASRLASAGKAAIVFHRDALPVSQALSAARHETSRPADFLLHGGEDYELLFCTSAAGEDVYTFASDDVPITRIGRVEEGEGVWLESAGGERERISLSGFDHF